MKTPGMFQRLLVVGLGLAVISVSTSAYARRPGGGGGGGGGCPRNIECLDVWDPVICSDGVVYSNSCYAYRACATGCTPYGDI